jgi:hypothetical protein
VVIRPPKVVTHDRRRNVESLVAAHERLWSLRQSSGVSARPWIGPRR